VLEEIKNGGLIHNFLKIILLTAIKYKEKGRSLNGTASVRVLASAGL